MTLKRADRDGCAVLAISGEVDLASEVELADRTREARAEVPDGPVVLDLSGVTFLSSSGLGTLLALSQEAQGQGAVLRIVADLTVPGLRAIRAMRLEEVLSIYRTQDEAVAG